MQRAHLTSIGDEVFSQARHGIDLRETIDNIVSRQRAEVSGSLRIASTPGIARSVIAPLVRDFQKSFPTSDYKLSSLNVMTIN